MGEASLGGPDPLAPGGRRGHSLLPAGWWLGYISVKRPWDELGRLPQFTDKTWDQRRRDHLRCHSEQDRQPDLVPTF